MRLFIYLPYFRVGFIRRQAIQAIDFSGRNTGTFLNAIQSIIELTMDRPGWALVQLSIQLEKSAYHFGTLHTKLWP